MLKRYILFLILNFAGLAIGSYYTAAVTGDWYAGLQRAPWEPPGWVFGAAWTLIMLLFSYYLASAKKYLEKSELRIFYWTYAGSWLLNVVWNPVFFEGHMVELGLFILICLLLFIVRFYQVGRREMRWEWVLALPYLIWMLIAISLNAYILTALS